MFTHLSNLIFKARETINTSIFLFSLIQFDNNSGYSSTVTDLKEHIDDIMLRSNEASEHKDEKYWMYYCASEYMKRRIKTENVKIISNAVY